MNKRKIIAACSIVLAIAIVSASAIIYYQGRNPVEPVQPVEEFSIPETNERINPVSSENSGLVEAYKISPPVPKEVIENEEENTTGDEALAVTETADQDGTTVQTPNWEVQKELVPGTDLENPDKQPEYKAPAASSTASAASSKTGSTPKNGDTKTIDGYKYTYVDGFGWVKNGGANERTEIDVELSGNKVGH